MAESPQETCTPRPNAFRKDAGGGNEEACGHEGQRHFGDSCWPSPALTDRSLPAPALRAGHVTRPACGCPQQASLGGPARWAQSQRAVVSEQTRHKHGKGGSAADTVGRLARAQNFPGRARTGVTGQHHSTEGSVSSSWPSVPGPAPTRSRESLRWRPMPTQADAGSWKARLMSLLGARPCWRPPGEREAECCSQSSAVC